MLSKENEDKIIVSGLYKHKPDMALRGRLYSDDLYHCCNWTFRPQQRRDGSWYMADTYWSCGDESSIELTDKNFNEFELIFDFNNVTSTNYPEEYDNADTYWVAIDSGGMYCGGKHFVKKDAKKSKEKLISRCKDEISSCEYNLKNLKRELSELENGTHWKLK